MAQPLSTRESFHNQARAYLNEVPANTLQEATKAFVISFLVTGVLSGGNVVLAASSGILSGTATIVHGLVSPMFKHMLNGRTTLRFHEEVLRTGAAIFGTGVLASCAGVGHVLTNAFHSLFVMTIFNVFSNILIGSNYRHRVDHANSVYV